MGQRVLVDRANLVPLFNYGSYSDDYLKYFVCWDNEGIVATLTDSNIPLPREKFILLDKGKPLSEHALQGAFDSAILDNNENSKELVVLTDENQFAVCKVLTVGNEESLYLVNKKVVVEEDTGFIVELSSGKYRLLTKHELLLEVLEEETDG